MTSRHFEVVTSIKLLLVSICYYILDNVSTTEFSVIQVVVNHNTKLPWPGTARIWRPAALGWRFAVLCWEKGQRQIFLRAMFWTPGYCLVGQREDCILQPPFDHHQRHLPNCQRVFLSAVRISASIPRPREWNPKRLPENVQELLKARESSQLCSLKIWTLPIDANRP